VSYGSRARIGYTCPVYLAEIFPYDFYKMVPDGVTMVTATASVWRMTPEELKTSAEQSIRAARAMAESGVNVVVIGGVPVGFASGYSHISELTKELQAESGIPTTASLLCQNHALQTLGAKKVVVLRTGSSVRKDQHMQELEGLGLEILDIRPVGDNMYSHPPEARHTLELARALLSDNPGADTLHCPSPHWPMAANIQALEDEFKVNVVTAGQAIVWEALRLAGINDHISGYGRLLEHF
jgi:maleate isomerase